VQHPEAVEPVVQGAGADLELGRPNAVEGALEPGRQPALQRQRIKGPLVFEAAEAEAVVRRGGVGRAQLTLLSPPTG
jgi:hypothetical protein